MNDHKVFVAVFGIIKNERGEILFQKRQNTGFADGYFQLPSGHLDIEPAESIEAACIRELKEELGIIVSTQELSLRFCHHSYGPGTKNYLGFFFDVQSYSGDIVNTEPEKCESLEWIHPDMFHESKIVKYVRENLLDTARGVFRVQRYEKAEEFLG